MRESRRVWCMLASYLHAASYVEQARGAASVLRPFAEARRSSALRARCSLLSALRKPWSSIASVMTSSPSIPRPPPHHTSPVSAKKRISETVVLEGLGLNFLLPAARWRSPQAQELLSVAAQSSSDGRESEARGVRLVTGLFLEGNGTE